MLHEYRPGVLGRPEGQPPAPSGVAPVAPGGDRGEVPAGEDGVEAAQPVVVSKNPSASRCATAAVTCR